MHTPRLLPLLSLQNIGKRYSKVVANQDVSLQIWPGQAHALLGENGAGKSTLMKIICGVVQPDQGQIFFQGRAVRLRHPQQARALGIGMVFQHFSLFEALSVAENVWLGLDSSWSLTQVKQGIRAKALEYGLQIDPERPVHSLSVGQKQQVEILRALLGEPQLLVLDEPSAVLTPQATDQLLALLRQLLAKGCGLLYISHKLNEVRALCSTCTVLRAGHVSGVCDPRQESNASLSRLMLGTDLPRPSDTNSSATTPGPVVLDVQDLNLPKRDPLGVDLQHMAFQVRAGEIVGIAGVSGNGQRELLGALSGEDRRAAPASIGIHAAALLNGAGLRHAVGAMGPQERREWGLHLVPEERLGSATVPAMSLAQNLLLTRKEALSRRLLGWIRTKALARQTQHIIERFKIKTSGPHASAQSLSGGNLQKFIMGRAISAQPRLLIAAQPTWGLDVAAATQIRQELRTLRDAGCAVLVLSEEWDELLELCDRLHVIAQGRLSPALSQAEASAERLGSWMSGLWEEASHAAA